MQAVKGLWQFWYWTTDTATRELIEDTLLAAMGQPQPAWVESNLEDAVYNLADENIRYFYNNWVALLPSAEDRDRAVRGRLAVESRLATKFAAVLEKAPAPQKKRLLRALTEFPLRRGDIYDPEADITDTGAAGVQPHRQRHRTDRVLWRKRRADRTGALPAPGRTGCRDAKACRRGRAAGARRAVR
jgi:hypothetical protein